MIIGISGKSGTGKSHVAKFLKRKIKFRLISANKIRREILKEEKLKNDLVTTFGRKILHKNGTVDHSRLILQAGRDTLRLKVLSDYIDGQIGEEIRKQVTKEQDNYIIKSSNLIGEGISDLFDVSVLVVTPLRLAIGRQISKVPLNIIQNVWRFQKDVKDYDYVIENKTRIKDLRDDVEELFAEMLKMEGGKKKKEYEVEDEVDSPPTPSL